MPPSTRRPQVQPTRAQRGTVPVIAASGLPVIQLICAERDHLERARVQQDLLLQRGLVKQCPFPAQLDVTADQLAPFCMGNA